MDLPALLAVFTDAGKFLSIFISGITAAGFLFLVAAGLTLILGVLDVLNFAHGALYMIGAYVAFYVMSLTGNFGVALIVGPIVVGIIAVLMERFFVRRVHGRGHAYQVLITYGFILVFDDSMRAIAGTAYRTVATPALFRATLNIAGSTIPSYYLFVIGITIIVIIALYYFIYKTKWGMTIRAAAAEPEMLSSLGVNVSLVYTFVFGIGCLLAGVGAVLVTPMRAVYTGMGGSVIIDCFVIAVIGGLGNLHGALLASLIIGMVRAFGVVGFPLFEMGFIFIVMIIVLSARPQGLFGRAGA